MYKLIRKLTGMTFRCVIREWNVYFPLIKQAVNINILDLRQTAKPICCEWHSSGWYVRSDGHAEKKRWHKGVQYSPPPIPGDAGYSIQRTETRDVCTLHPLFRDIGLNPLSQQSGWNVSDALITHKCQPAVVSGVRPACFKLPLFRKSIILSSRSGRRLRLRLRCVR